MLRRAAVLFIVVFALGALSAVLIVNSLNVVQRVTFISHIRGPVEVKEPGEADFRPLTAEARVLAGSIVRTGKDAGALLHWVDGTRLQAGAETTLTVLECRLDKRTDQVLSLFQLEVGRIWVRVIRSLSADSKFEIQTPTATAGVRGTTFALEVGADGATDVLVYEGNVHVQSGGQGFSVPQGQALAIRAEGDGTARELTEDERDRAERAGLGKPLLSITHPKGERSVRQGEPLTVRGRTDAGAELSIDGESVPVEADGTFSFDFTPAAKGGQTIEITATDALGEETSERLTIKTD